MKFKTKKLPSNINYYLLAFLFIFTATTTSHFFPLGISGLIVFSIAYISKGMRKVTSPQEKT